MMEQICRDWITYESKLTPAQYLGRGSYGYVTLMEDPESRGYAKKTSSMNLLNNLQKELDIMLRFHNHPRIIRATSPSVHFEKNSNGERVCYIYMEYANKSSLQRLMFEEFRGISMPEYTIQRATRMILQGLEALHASGYVHCDLKPANILLFDSTTRGEPFDLKLADFGLSKELNSGSASLPESIIGTPLYMAPEAFRPHVPIDPARDIWSLGSVVHEMFGGKPTREELEDYYDWKLVGDVSPVVKDFLRQCHDMRSHRPTAAAELLNHPFITQKLSPPLPSITLESDWMRIQKLPDSIW